MKILKDFFGILINLDLILIIALISMAFFPHEASTLSQCIGLMATFILLIPLPRLIFHKFEYAFKVPEKLPLDAKGFILLGGTFNFMSSAGVDKITERNPRIKPPHIDRPHDNPAAGRLLEFITLAQRHPDLRILITGTPYESAWTQQIFKEIGMDLKRVIIENESYNTEDNEENSYQIIKPKTKDQWILVTSAFHMPRSYNLFTHAGWNIIPYPVDFHTPRDWTWRNFFLATQDRLNLYMWRTVMQEIAGIINYKLEGKTATFWLKK
jgi:uncharacterized SAM-binding protein YcdF (DUF218 family)